MRVSHLTTFSPTQVYFIAEIVAYDISMICETAFNQKVAYQDQIVALLLEVDEVPDDKAQLETLRGVRKAQIKLATFYLAQGETERAVMIRQDMADEPHDRLESIQMELMSVQSASFWELEDRGYNFEFLTPDRKQQLPTFLSLPVQMESPNLSVHEARMRKRANRGSSRGSTATLDTPGDSTRGDNLERLDLTPPGSTPSSLLPGLSARRGTPGHTPGAGGATQLTVSSTPASGASVPGSVPGSAATSEGGADGVPLIARIPEETLRASIDADDGTSA